MSNFILDSLDLKITFAALILIVVNLILTKRINSVLITTLAFLLVQSISFAFIALVRDSQSDLSPFMTRVVWYFGFAFVDLLAVVLIYKLHSALKEIYSLSATTAVWVLLYLGALQVLSFVDRQYGYDLLAFLYKWSIPACNVAILMMLAVSTVMLGMQKRGYSGIKGI